MKVLITGSRVCSESMAEKVRDVIQWIADQGYELIVGDADGVDTLALRFMSKLALLHRVSVYNGRSYSSFLARDRVMVLACDLCVAIWDGESKGTHYTFNFARSQGKKVIVRTFCK